MRLLLPGIILATSVGWGCSSRSSAPADEVASADEVAPADEVTPADEVAPTDEVTPNNSAEPALRPMMVEFSRDYCTPCQVMKPWVAEIANENPGVDVLTLNVDRKKYEHIGSFFKVTAVPGLLFIAADGQVVRRSEGLANKDQMTKALEELGWAR